MSLEDPSLYASRLAALRHAMHHAGVDAYYIPSADPHLSEYLPEHWQGRQWLTGFEGSAGNVLVTQEFAGLWTDSRYWVQAEQQFRASPFTLMRQGEADVPSITDWVRQHMPANAVLAFDGKVMSVAAYEAWESLSQEGWTINAELDLFETIWQERPPLPLAPIFEHESEYVAQTRAQKIAGLRQQLIEHQADWWLLSSLDDIAWLLNLRGNDVPYNPVFLAHALVSAHTFRLYLEESKVSTELMLRLAEDGISLRPYDMLSMDLLELPIQQSLGLDPQRVTVGTLQNAQHLHWLPLPNPTQTTKAIKADSELAHIRRAMEKDGAALCVFFAQFEQQLAQGQRLTELDVDQRLTAARAQQPDFISPSFGTIAAFGANGAMPHYQATPQAFSVIEGDGLLLIDSGGQYLDGTTDITRVVPIGQITDAQKTDYTRVLKGMVALSRAVFPRGVTGQQLDVLARAPLWEVGLEFGHGTGHGVGYFLNVHEGPQSISWRGRNPAVPLEVGMITSNEPGLYRAGEWGIRIENLVAVQPALSTEFGDFLSFETLTLCPIDTRCLNLSLLNAAEVEWLNGYHQEVRERLSPYLHDEALAWLIERTEPIL